MLDWFAACSPSTRCAVNTPGRKPSPLSVPAAFLQRHTIMITLATLPVLVFGAAAVSRPAPTPPVPVKLVQTEGVRVIRLDSQTFRARWSPVSDMPPATEVRYTQPAAGKREHVDGGEVAVAGTVTGAAHPTALPPRHRMRSRSASLDVCARHGQRKVMVGRYKWRCRR